MNEIKSFLFFILISVVHLSTFSQSDTTGSKLEWSGDFRFRVEQDWDSRKSDGTFRDDRTRLRYRARLGLHYDLDATSSFRLRIRTGNPIKQQDPQLTLGAGEGEFNTVPISFEKLFYRYRNDWLELWLGKNDFPFTTMNELFWSENVFPEGISITLSRNPRIRWMEKVRISAGHFIMRSSGSSLNNDSYLQGVQLEGSFLDDRIKVYPGFFLFENMPDIPDGFGTYLIRYELLHAGIEVLISKKHRLRLQGEILQNQENLSDNDSIPSDLSDEKSGTILGLVYGNTKKKKDVYVRIAYTHLERYAAVDFLAQNDWARWDYSSFGSPDGRLTNMAGFEVKAAFMLKDNMKLSARFFQVEQLVEYGEYKETNSRIRFDLDVNF